VTWIYLLDVNHARKMKSKSSLLVFQNFLATVQTESQIHCALCSGEGGGAIYIKMTVATGTGDATMLIAYEDHSSNEPMR
jgi:hypothetical protein